MKDRGISQCFIIIDKVILCGFEHCQSGVVAGSPNQLLKTKMCISIRSLTVYHVNISVV